MPGRAEEEHPAPRLCLVTAQGTSEGRKQSLSLGLKIKFKHQEVTQMHLQKGRSCKRKASLREAMCYCRLLAVAGPEHKSSMTPWKEETLQRTELFHIFPSHWIRLSSWRCSLTAVRYPDRYRYASPTVAGQKAMGYWHSDMSRIVSGSLTARLNHPLKLFITLHAQIKLPAVPRNNSSPTKASMTASGKYFAFVLAPCWLQQPKASFWPSGLIEGLATTEREVIFFPVLQIFTPFTLFSNPTTCKWQAPCVDVEGSEEMPQDRGRVCCHCCSRDYQLQPSYHI